MTLKSEVVLKVTHLFSTLSFVCSSDCSCFTLVFFLYRGCELLEDRALDMGFIQMSLGLIETLEKSLDETVLSLILVISPEVLQNPYMEMWVDSCNVTWSKRVILY